MPLSSLALSARRKNFTGQEGGAFGSESSFINWDIVLTVVKIATNDSALSPIHPSLRKMRRITQPEKP
jgi:hypothetical protein